MATQIFVKDIIERIKTFDKSEAANWLKAKCTQPEEETAADRSFTHVINNTYKKYQMINKSKQRPGYAAKMESFLT